MGHSIHAEVMLVLSFYIIAPGGVKLRLTGFAEAPLPAELSFQPSVLLFKIYFIYLGVYIYISLSVCMHTCVWMPSEARGGHQSPGAGLAGSSEQSNMGSGD